MLNKIKNLINRYYIVSKYRIIKKYVTDIKMNILDIGAGNHSVKK